MSPVLNEAQLRDDWAPKCEHIERAHMVDAWLALDTVMHFHVYAPRQGETYAANCRATTGGSSPSLHSFMGKASWTTWTGVVVQTAVATDFNSTSNPYSTRLVTDMPREMIDDILAIRTNNGVPVFHWGGYFSSHKDAMHFQFCCSHADLATGIDHSTVRGHGATQGDDDMNATQEAKLDQALARATEAATRSFRVQSALGISDDGNDSSSTVIAQILTELKADAGHGLGTGDVDPTVAAAAIAQAFVDRLKD